jgi:hypothetical protein
VNGSWTFSFVNCTTANLIQTPSGTFGGNQQYPEAGAVLTSARSWLAFVNITGNGAYLQASSDKNQTYAPAQIYIIRIPSDTVNPTFDRAYNELFGDLVKKLLKLDVDQRLSRLVSGYGDFIPVVYESKEAETKSK